ncbi:MAG: Fe2+-dependent dioxygenase [Aestuariivirga sp.]
MLLNIADVLDAASIAAIHFEIEKGGIVFTDGNATAGWQAKAVKKNEQAAGPALQSIIEKTSAAILAHPLFRAAANPKQLVKVMLSRYKPGMAYGTHVDNALMGGIRTDLSFTLFLKNPESYKGGALVIEGNDGDTEIKLQAGSLVLYPTTALHHVSEVTSGERLAIVGWVRSYIRSHENRETLFDLENAISSLRLANADRAILDRLLKVKANLMRGWVED